MTAQGQAPFLHSSWKCQNGLQNRPFLALSSSLNICNHCENSHGLHACADAFAFAKQTMLRRKGEALLEIIQ
jgi:hypothetical protein